MDFIKDRANIKWTAMMLPEHKMELIGLQIAQEDVKPPDDDLDRLTEIEERLARAKNEDLVVQIRYWKNKRNEEVIGRVRKLDPIMKAVLIFVDEDDKRWVEARHIVDLDLSAQD